MAKEVRLPDEVASLIDKYAERYGMDAKILRALAYQESEGKQTARSKAGAIGVMQLMPETAKGLNVDPTDLEQNIEGGVRFFATMLAQNKGDVRNALAAYNAGQGAVDRAGGIPDNDETPGYVRNIMQMSGYEGAATPAAKGIPSGQALLTKAIARKDRIAGLPPEVRNIVLDRIFDLAVSSKIPKAMNDQQRALIKQRFVDSFTGQPPTPDVGPTESEYKRAGFDTGMLGRVKSGTMEGLANIWDMLGKITMSGNKNDPAFADVRKFQQQDVEALRGGAEAQRGATEAYTTRHPTKAMVGEAIGQGLPSVPLEAAIPGAPPGMTLPGRLGVNALKGGVGFLPYDPSVAGFAKGAAFSAPFTLARPLARAALKPFQRTAAAAAPKVVDPAAAKFADMMEATAKTKFSKGLKDLTPSQRMEVITDLKNQASSDAEKARSAAAKAKVEAKAKAADEKVTSNVESRRRMDEAKNLQKHISSFVKDNKRAPTDAELVELRQKATAGPPAAPSEVPKPKGESGVYIREEPKPGFGTAKVPIEEQAKPMGEAHMAAHANAFEQAKAEWLAANPGGDYLKGLSQINQRAAEIQNPAGGKAIDPIVAKADAFKAENPEAIKAAAAVTNIANAQGVIKVPEGVSGLTPVQQEINKKLDNALTALAEAKDPKVISQIKKTVENLKAGLGGDEEALKRVADAERKAAERGKAAATTSTLGAGPEGTPASELVASQSKTPEQQIEELETQFFSITDALEEHGPEGKAMAKNLNTLWKKPPKGFTREQVVEAGEKALSLMKGK